MFPLPAIPYESLAAIDQWMARQISIQDKKQVDEMIRSLILFNATCRSRLARAYLSISMTTRTLAAAVIITRLSPRYDEDPCPRMKEGVVKWHRDSYGL